MSSVSSHFKNDPRLKMSSSSDGHDRYQKKINPLDPRLNHKNIQTPKAPSVAKKLSYLSEKKSEMEAKKLSNNPLFDSYEDEAIPAHAISKRKQLLPSNPKTLDLAKMENSNQDRNMHQRRKFNSEKSGQDKNPRQRNANDENSRTGLELEKYSPLGGLSIKDERSRKKDSLRNSLKREYSYENPPKQGFRDAKDYENHKGNYQKERKYERRRDSFRESETNESYDRYDKNCTGYAKSREYDKYDRVDSRTRYDERKNYRERISDRYREGRRGGSLREREGSQDYDRKSIPRSDSVINRKYKVDNNSERYQRGRKIVDTDREREKHSLKKAKSSLEVIYRRERIQKMHFLEKISGTNLSKNTSGWGVKGIFVPTPDASIIAGPGNNILKHFERSEVILRFRPKRNSREADRSKITKVLIEGPVERLEAIEKILVDVVMNEKLLLKHEPLMDYKNRRHRGKPSQPRQNNKGFTKLTKGERESRYRLMSGRGYEQENNILTTPFSDEANIPLNNRRSDFDSARKYSPRRMQECDRQIDSFSASRMKTELPSRQHTRISSVSSNNQTEQIERTGSNRRQREREKKNKDKSGQTKRNKNGINKGIFESQNGQKTQQNNNALQMNYNTTIGALQKQVRISIAPKQSTFQPFQNTPGSLKIGMPIGVQPRIGGPVPSYSNDFPNSQIYAQKPAAFQASKPFQNQLRPINPGGLNIGQQAMLPNNPHFGQNLRPFTPQFHPQFPPNFQPLNVPMQQMPIQPQHPPHEILPIVRTPKIVKITQKSIFDLFVEFLKTNKIKSPGDSMSSIPAVIFESPIDETFSQTVIKLNHQEAERFRVSLFHLPKTHSLQQLLPGNIEKPNARPQVVDHSSDTKAKQDEFELDAKTHIPLESENETNHSSNKNDSLLDDVSEISDFLNSFANLDTSSIPGLNLNDLSLKSRTKEIKVEKEEKSKFSNLKIDEVSNDTPKSSLKSKNDKLNRFWTYSEEAAIQLETFGLLERLSILTNWTQQAKTFTSFVMSKITKLCLAVIQQLDNNFKSVDENSIEKKKGKIIEKKDSNERLSDVRETKKKNNEKIVDETLKITNEDKKKEVKNINEEGKTKSSPELFKAENFFFVSLVENLNYFGDENFKIIRLAIKEYPGHVLHELNRLKNFSAEGHFMQNVAPIRLSAERRPQPNFVEQYSDKCSKCPVSEGVNLCSWCLRNYCRNCIGNANKPPCKTCQKKMTRAEKVKMYQSASFEICRERMRQSFDSSSELQETSVVFPLYDPFSYKRIEIPVKGRNCKHRNVFDLDSFIKQSANSKTQNCPLCKNPTSLEELEVDSFVKRIIMTEDEDVREVNIRRDGSWSRTFNERETTARAKRALPLEEKCDESAAAVSDNYVQNNPERVEVDYEGVGALKKKKCIDLTE